MPLKFGLGINGLFKLTANKLSLLL